MEENLVMAFGRNCRRIRERVGWTLDELSQAAGGSPSPSELSRLERGLLRRTSYETLAPIADALGTTVDALAGREDTLSDEESELVLLFRALPKAERSRQLAYFRWLGDVAEEFNKEAAMQAALERMVREG